MSPVWNIERYPIVYYTCRRDLHTAASRLEADPIIATAILRYDILPRSNTSLLVVDFIAGCIVQVPTGPVARHGRLPGQLRLAAGIPPTRSSGCLARDAL